MIKWKLPLRGARSMRGAEARAKWRIPAAAVLSFAGCVAAGDYYLRGGVVLDRSAKTVFTPG